MEDPPRLGSDLETLVRRRGARLVRSECVSRHGATGESRETFRLEFDDGTTLKGRRVRSAATAKRIEQLVGKLDPDRFPRVLARRGVALLEAWIEGEPLDRLPASDAHLRWAAETLGRVHGTVPARSRRLWLRARCTMVASHLWTLVRAGVLGTADAKRLLETGLAAAPDAADLTITHRDICPENIVETPEGRLVSIDNAAVRVGAADEDLARTCYRWPLDGRQRDLFLEGYGAFRDPGGFLGHRRFWMVAALSHAAWIRHSKRYAHPDVPLRRLLAEADGTSPEVPCFASGTAR